MFPYTVCRTAGSPFILPLIELLVVIAIIGILAVIAMPSYHQYTERAHFAEVIVATSPYKTAIALALQQGTLMEELNEGTHGIPEAPKPTANLLELTISNSIITAKSSQLAGDATLILTPNADGTLWNVSGTCIAKGLCNF